VVPVGTCWRIIPSRFPIHGSLTFPDLSAVNLQMPGKRFFAILLCCGGIAVWLWQGSKGGPQASVRSDHASRHRDEGDASADPSKASRRPKPESLPVEKLAEATLSGLQSPDSGQRRLALDTLLPDLIGKDLDAAADLVKGLEPWASAEEAAGLLLDHWAETDAMAAAAWCTHLDPGKERDRWLARVSGKLAERDPAAAMTMLEVRHLAADLTAIGPVLHHWARRDMEGAVEWISGQSNSELCDAAWSRLALSLAESHPEAAATLAATNISGERQQEEAVISVLHQWILRDRKAAAAWVALFPEGPLRQRAEDEFNGTH